VRCQCCTDEHVQDHAWQWQNQQSDNADDEYGQADVRVTSHLRVEDVQRLACTHGRLHLRGERCRIMYAYTSMIAV
jgi:hypothetical protein